MDADDILFGLVVGILAGMVVFFFGWAMILMAEGPQPTFEQRCHDRGGVVLVEDTECVKSEQLERIVID